MQVVETSVEGLKRQLRVVVEAGEINERFSTRLDEIKDQVQLKGFRKGKVPLAHLKKVFGRQLMAEVLEKAVEETSRQALTDRKERPALQPEIQLPEDEKEIESVLDGGKDLSYDMSFEVLPEIEIKDFKDLTLERLVADVDEQSVADALDKLAERAIGFEAQDGREAQDGDQVTIDFKGFIGDEAFEGGTAEDVQVTIGQSGFIEGFEEGLKGAKANDERTVKATFPENYPVAELAGKEASFEVKVKQVAVPKKPEINDDFASTLGVESLEKLKEMVGEQIKGEYAQATRAKLKNQILDQLEKSYDFVLPPSLVDREFESMWQEVTQSLERAGKTFADEGKNEDEARAEYRKVAERRVRLGLLIGEIGDKNQIQVNQEELKRAVLDRARQFPGQERAVLEYYEKNPSALIELRMPIFEEKVIDLIAEIARPTERKVSREDLFAPIAGENDTEGSAQG
ncbi:MAG: hypothetical protein RLZ98_2965 [Pseudomonadota bacterium]|jgi:trigger factor